MRKALDEWKCKCSGIGIPLEYTTLCTLQFADDQVVLAGVKEEYMMRKIKETYEKWGLVKNFNKNKILIYWGKAQKFEVRQRKRN